MDPMLIVTIAAVALASTMSLVAWRVVREDRRRSEARVAALAADVHGVGAAGGDLPLRDEAPDALALFGGAEPQPRKNSTLAVVLGASALVVVGVAAGLMVARTAGPVDPRRSSAELAEASTPPSAVAAEPPALELVALGHNRGRDGLTVRGSVRNPDNALVPNRLTAVVLVFDTEGGFLTSGRTDVNTRDLSPGTEAPFEVAIPAAAEVGRYRVSFRSDDRVVPHVDRRR